MIGAAFSVAYVACSSPYQEATVSTDAGNDVLPEAGADVARDAPCSATFCDDFDQEGRPDDIRGAWDDYASAGGAHIESDTDFSVSSPRSILFVYPPSNGTPNVAYLEKRFSVAPTSIQLAFDYRLDTVATQGVAAVVLALTMGSGNPSYTANVRVRPEGSPVLGETIPRQDGSVGYPSQSSPTKIARYKPVRLAVDVTVSDSASVLVLKVNGVEVDRRALSAHQFRGPLTVRIGDSNLTENEASWTFRIDNLILDVK
ncbi:MAG: hypothetical protein U0270_41540 [Labilithrix sp.]